MGSEARGALGNALCGAVALAITAAGWLSLRRDPTLATYDFGSDPGPALVPRLLLAALGIGGAILAGHGAWRLARPPGAPPGSRGARPRLRRLLVPALFVASLFLYQHALPLAGYRAATVAFCVVWIVLLTWRRDERLTLRLGAVSVGSAALVTAGIYVVFRVFVRVPLP